MLFVITNEINISFSNLNSSSKRLTFPNKSFTIKKKINI